VNDTYGHAVGDAVIAAFGELLSCLLRETDCAGRIGGEEFEILLWEADVEGAARFAERARAAFARTRLPGLDESARFTVSFGVTELAPGEPLASARRRADAALYQAKRQGRDRVAAAPAPGQRPPVREDDALPVIRLTGPRLPA